MRLPKSKKPNTFTEQEVEILITAFEENLYDYQWDWYRAGNQRTRAILKSRQIGATYYFAREAFIDALKTGRNQIFLSASKAQAHIFKTYIQQFAFEHTGVELKGDPIIIGNNQANLTFWVQMLVQLKATTVISISTNFSGRMVLTN